MRTSTVKPLFTTCIFLLFSLGLAGAQAALPPTLNYQGHLTDDGGAPVDGPVSMTFRLYDVDAGGIALWSDTLSVTLNQGVFSVELGSSASPFPPGLFETPLWIGLSVGADAEMTPRRPVTSSGYAFKAADANTLDGSSASSLDQSAHVSDTANPHNVTAAQTGAADAATLASHIGNLSNPHSVTAAQTGAASSANFIAHIADSSAHHLRYTDTEAVAAMGANNNANPLNHDRYSKADAVAAILAADGAGSTLDSDKVDGLEASELIDAAQDEVRTPISSLPYTINQPGSYYLTGNLDGSSGGIDITTDDVTLDLMGFTIDGDGTIADYGINFTSHNNVTIRNGTIKRFGYAGIYQGDATARYAKVMDVQALGNGSLGTTSAYSGIYIRSSNSHVERCTAGDNGGLGISAYVHSVLINNTAFNNNNTGIAGNDGSVLSGNAAYNNGVSGIYGGRGSSVSGNTAYNNATIGIYGGSGSSISGNIARDNDGNYGIQGGSGSSISDNTAYNNANYGIYAGSGSSISGNIVYSNAGWGIYGSGSNHIKDNAVYFNNGSGTAGQGGLRVGYDSRVVGNSLDTNYQNNIYVSSSDNILKDNHVTDSINGIFFNTSGNYYRDNTGSGNTTTFNLNGTTQTSGGGNVLF